ncbi:MAG: hypothetical protein ACT4OX_11785 [Actinomycetota bacterium]
MPAGEARPTFDDTVANDPSAHARVIAVTAVRAGTAKRGVAAAIAIAIARARPGRVCVLDADLTMSDVAMRFNVIGPTFLELARALEDEPDRDACASIAVDPASGCLVIPAGAGRDIVDSSAYSRVIYWLRDHVDQRVIDVPPRLATMSRPADKNIKALDAVVVATTPHADELGAAIDYLNSITRAQIVGNLPSWIEFHLLITGTDTELASSRLTLERTRRAVDSSAVLPCLWGRNAASPIGDDGTLQGPFAALVDQLLVTDVRRTATRPHVER